MNEPTEYLTMALRELHSQLAARPNASTATMEGAKALRLTLPQALSLALGTLGEAHAPIRQTYNLVKSSDGDFERAVEKIVYDKGFVPGWGSGFAKDGPDRMIESFFADNITDSWRGDMVTRTQLVQGLTGKKIWPNAACATAYAALQLGEDATWAEAQMVRGRMNPWIWTYEGA